MSYLLNGIPSNCCGCRACEDACSVSAITFVEDKTGGYVYPKIDTEKCIACKACQKVCPLGDNALSGNALNKAYVAKHKNAEVLSKSASGGAFQGFVSVLSKQYHDIVIYGAKLDENHKVILDAVYSANEAAVFSKSKYVQSNANHCYSRVKADLQKNKTVLFTGLPCQVGALRQYLKRDYENLICIDIVCHGVPSQHLFDMYLREVEHKAGGKKIVRYVFRNKKDITPHMNSSTVLIEFADKSEKVIDSVFDPYLRMYHGRINYRPSCYKCRFATPQRMGDVTIADGYGANRIKSHLNTREGVSLVLPNTEKGAALVEHLKDVMEVYDMDYSLALSLNGCLTTATREPKARSAFISMINSGETFHKSAEKAIKVGMFEKLLRRILTFRQMNRLQALHRKILKKK